MFNLYNKTGQQEMKTAMLGQETNMLQRRIKEV